MTKELHVAILGSRGYPYVYSGYETLVRHLAEGLVARGVKVTVYCHKNLFEERPRLVNGVNLIYQPTIEKKSLSQLVHTAFSMWHACRSDANVIFVVNSANGPFGLLARLFGKPTAINVDGLEWLRPKWKGLGARYFKWSSRVATKWYDQIITDAEEMRKVYLQLFDKESTVIAYGAEIKKSKKPELIEQWGLKSGEFYLIVGRLIPDNNADLIVDGFVASKTKRKLVVVGDVPYKDEYADRIKGTQDERLVFTGYVKDQEALAELYHHAYGYFHGHEFGGTNPTMIKAMAYGSAILALDTVFNREMLNEGDFGVFFKKDITMIKALIDQMDGDADQMKKMKQTSSLGVSSKYSWPHIVSQYQEVFEGLVKP